MADTDWLAPPQTALFASWFTCESRCSYQNDTRRFIPTNIIPDGLSGIFWLFLNFGRYGENWKKMFLTCLNLVIVVIGGCLVSTTRCEDAAIQQ
jgi:hypothetical protein